MALDPNERPPYGGPTYKTRDWIEIIVNFVLAGVIALAAFGYLFVRGGLWTVPVPIALAILSVLLVRNGRHKLEDFHRRWD